MAADEDIQERIWVAIDFAKQGHYEMALPIFDRCLSQLTTSIADKRLAGAAFSFYGLCVAKVERRYSRAVECCNISLKADRFDANHRANLAKVYLEAGDRKKAVATMREGLKIDPRHTAIHRMWKDIGRRRPPVLSFLSRENPLNIFLGRLLRSNKGSGD